MSQRPGNTLFVAARLQRGWHSQADVAAAYERHAAALGESASITVRQVRRWESPAPGWPNTIARRVLRAMFGVPLEDLGFVPLRPAQQQLDDTSVVVGAGPDRDPGKGPARRGTFPGGVLAGAAPLLDASALDHLAAAVASARRYTDHHLVAHLRAALDEAARTDGRTGPRQALPAALGILGAIDEIARDASSAVRRDLLAVGARAAEFTAWLHRDAGAPPHTTVFFHDRAIEWATLSGDGPMHAYVLLRKAQATERDDAARMRDLAHAAVHGPWALPPRARAEALQQQARAMALTGTAPDLVSLTLDQAHDALDQAAPAEPATCTGPLCAGYNHDRLMAQSAICHREAGQPERAVVLLRQHLSGGAFAPRDRAFFTAHLAGALAAAGEPDEAAATGLSALQLAAAPHFGQALGELRRTVAVLRPYARRAAVRELRQALTVLPG
ncbi:XRE family transcriptional regulator (plasmid) [Streptomyces sp. HU2014]|uniref:XRE family transcriptional regulator n=1 Tax=Streptomyces sp. HU2014 TaxID=2939414 RepID=UPI00200BFC0D|nr:XRE family transcriptional regulator [Streptomyces sp. HU2014]UQI49802.1 XRE family transcriptional regulator [Streptomyces sp. HU2014]